MADTQLDPSGFFQFDIAHGVVRTKHGQRVLMLSEQVLSPLVNAAVESGDLTSIRMLGSELGTLTAQSLGQPLEDVGPEVAMHHAAAMVAMFGWGTLALERWGDALVVIVEGTAPLDDEDLAIAALLGGLFSTLVGQEVACVPIGEGSRYLMVDPSIAEEVWSWSRAGEDLPGIVSRLAPSEAA